MAVKAQGTKLKIGTAEIGELTSIGGLSLSADTIDVTTLGSTDGYREFIQGFRDAGEVSMSGFFKPSETTGQATLLTNLNDGSVDAYSIEFTALSYKWTFNAIVTALSTSAANDDAITFEATLKVSGKPTLAQMVL